MGSWHPRRRERVRVYLGSKVLRPGDDPGDDEYRIVFRFDQACNMRAWEGSQERRRWLKRADPLIHPR